MHLRETLKGPVVLDLAALDRKSVEPETTVQLALDGVRLKTGLKLLLDQVGLTYQVIAEDNLMIITDQEGSEDPADKIWAELRALHRDLHAVQDAVDDLTDFLGGEAGEGARVRKPTIIEEMPNNSGPRPGIGPKNPGAAARNQTRRGAPPQGATTVALACSAGGPAAAVFDRGSADCGERLPIPESRIQPESTSFSFQGRECGKGAWQTRAARSPARPPRAQLPTRPPGGAGSVNPRRRSGLPWLRPLLIGGGRKLSAWWRARKAVCASAKPTSLPAEIEAVAEHGRAGVYELLRIFSSSPTEALRLAAGRALARLWLLDQLVPEEEKAIVRRGYSVTWSARRRYPRAAPW